MLSSCPLAPGAIVGFGKLPIEVVDDVAVGWLMNMTLEPGSDLVKEGLPFDKAELEEEEGVTRMNLVTWDLSSVLALFKPVLLNSACVRTWGTPELLNDETATVFFSNEA